MHETLLHCYIMSDNNSNGLILRVCILMVISIVLNIKNNILNYTSVQHFLKFNTTLYDYTVLTMLMRYNLYAGKLLNDLNNNMKEVKTNTLPMITKCMHVSEQCFLKCKRPCLSYRIFLTHYILYKCKYGKTERGLHQNIKHNNYYYCYCLHFDGILLKGSLETCKIWVKHRQRLLHAFKECLSFSSVFCVVLVLQIKYNSLRYMGQERSMCQRRWSVPPELYRNVIHKSGSVSFTWHIQDKTPNCLYLVYRLIHLFLHHIFLHKVFLEQKYSTAMCNPI